MIQETLEEVAKSHAIYELENNYKPTKESFKLACKRNFIRGAKWQAERMYSEEEVKKLLISCKDKFSGGDLEDYHSDSEVIEWFKKRNKN